jgi:hypothetical protein
MMRLCRWLAAIVVWGTASVAAHAENGLERFEHEIKPRIQAETFSYASARPLGDDGFVLTDVLIVAPASDATGSTRSTTRIDTVTVEQADYDRWKSQSDDDLPRFAKVRLEGVVGDGDVFETLQPYGIAKAPLDIFIDYRLDATSKLLTLNALDVSLRGQGRLSLAFVMEGVGDKTGDVAAAKDKGRVRNASLTIEDKGMMAKLVPAVAETQGITADQMAAFALVSIAGFAQGQGPETLAALDALASFVADWKVAKGPLVVTLTPAQAVGFADLIRALEPNALGTVFGLKANYAGTRTGAATEAPK